MFDETEKLIVRFILTCKTCRIVKATVEAQGLRMRHNLTYVF